MIADNEVKRQPRTLINHLRRTEIATVNQRIDVPLDQLFDRSPRSLNFVLSVRKNVGFQSWEPLREFSRGKKQTKR